MCVIARFLCVCARYIERPVSSKYLNNKGIA